MQNVKKDFQLLQNIFTKRGMANTVCIAGVDRATIKIRVGYACKTWKKAGNKRNYIIRKIKSNVVDALKNIVGSTEKNIGNINAGTDNRIPKNIIKIRVGYLWGGIKKC